jgi:hypothetical protein
MKFLSLAPFVPAGSNFEKSKQLFLALGFQITWDGGGSVGFAKDGCNFILQDFDNQAFAENFMVSINVDDADAFWKEVMEKKLPETFGIKVSAPKLQPYGKEVNLIDIAGVCWHFIQS